MIPTTWRRLLAAAAATAAMTAPFGSPSWAAPAPTTTVPQRPLPASPAFPDGAIVNSWALAPTSNTEAQGGDRPNLSYETAAGSEVKDQITLYNLSNVQLNFRLYATDAFNNADGGFDLLPGDKKPTGVGTWITLPQENMTLPPRTQASMPVTIKVPVTASPGDHAGAILASSPAQGTGADGKVVILDRRTGPRVYVRVAGPLAPRLTVEKLSTTYHAALSPLGGTADVTYRVQNRGNVRMAGRQRVSVSAPLGLLSKKKAFVNLPEILPGEGVTFHASFKGVASSGISDAHVRLDPAPVGAAPEKPNSWTSFTLAPPFTILGIALSVWLLLRARRAYKRRERELGAQPSVQ